MMHVVCAVLDRKAKSYGPPLMFQNVDIARRMAQGLMANRSGGSDLDKYPEDFDLYLIGEFDTDTGVIGGGTPQYLFTFSDFVVKEV